MRVLTLLLVMLMPLVGAAQGDRALGRVTVEAISDDGRSETVTLYEASYALVVGVSDYTNGWKDLPGVRNDVTAVKAALETAGFEVTTLLNPDKAALEAAMDAFIADKAQRPPSRVVFYFAGHGHTEKFPDGRQRGYIVAANAGADPIGNPGAFARGAISMERVRVWAEDIRANHALFVFDSCFAGTIFRSRSNPEVPRAIQTKVARPVRQFIAAGGPDQEVPDESVFRQMFVRGLSGDADVTGDGYVTGTELGEYLFKQVPEYNPHQTPDYGKLRNPALDGGDVVFPLPGAGRPPTPEIVEVPGFDAAAQARERAEQRRKAEESRQQLLAAAKKAYDECVALEQDQYSTAEDRAAAWREYATKFEKADHQLAYAKERAEHWKNWKAPTPTPPATTAAPTNTPSPDGQRSSDGRYIKSSTGVITDTRTTLQWLPGPKEDISYRDSLIWVQICTHEGGGWRMPTQSEVGALYEKDRGDRNVDPIFALTGWWVWSDNDGLERPWSFRYYHGYEDPYRPASARLIAVRGSTTLPETRTSSDGRYTRKRSGVIIDKRTNLQWIVGPDYTINYDDAMAWVINCSVEGGGWRMPTRAELKGLKENSAIDQIFGWHLHWVWAEEYSSRAAWAFSYVGFGVGEVTGFGKNQRCYVLGVRASPQK